MTKEAKKILNEIRAIDHRCLFDIEGYSEEAERSLFVRNFVLPKGEIMQILRDNLI